MFKVIDLKGTICPAKKSLVFSYRKAAADGCICCSWLLFLFFIFYQTHESFNLSHLRGVSFLYLHLEYRSFGLFEAFLIDPEFMFKRENPWANKADNEYQTKDYELSLPIVIKKNNLHSFNLIANLLKFPLIPIS